MFSSTSRLHILQYSFSLFIIFCWCICKQQHSYHPHFYSCKYSKNKANRFKPLRYFFSIPYRLSSTPTFFSIHLKIYFKFFFDIIYRTEHSGLLYRKLPESQQKKQNIFEHPSFHFNWITFERQNKLSTVEHPFLKPAIGLFQAAYFKEKASLSSSESYIWFAAFWQHIWVMCVYPINQQ